MKNDKDSYPFLVKSLNKDYYINIIQYIRYTFIVYLITIVSLLYYNHDTLAAYLAIIGMPIFIGILIYYANKIE